MNELQPVTEVTLESFPAAVLQVSQQVPVLVDYWADWCGPCQMQMPLLHKLVEEYGGKFVIAKVNTDEQRQLAVAHNIRSLPTMRLYKHGEIVEEIAGAQTESTLRILLDRHIARESDRVREEARRLFDRANPGPALSLLAESHAREPDNHRLTLDYAGLCVRAGELDRAEALLDALPHDVRNETDALGVRAILDFSRAAGSNPDLGALQAAVERDPSDSADRYRLGAALLLAGETQPALDQFLYLLQHDRGFNEDAGRKALLATFDLLGKDNELAASYRRRMAAALY
jgi:putative thioredoxin